MSCNHLLDSAPDVSQPEREIGENLVRERHSPGGATETTVGHRSFDAHAGVRKLVPRTTTQLFRRQRSSGRPFEVCRSQLHFPLIKIGDRRPLFRLSVSGCCCLRGSSIHQLIFCCPTLQTLAKSSPPHPSPKILAFLCLFGLSFALRTSINVSSSFVFFYLFFAF